MKIEHLAIWVEDLQAMISFYEKYFEARTGKLYSNPVKGFSSCFLSFENQTRLELMHSEKLTKKDKKLLPVSGLAHLAFSCGSKDQLNKLTELLRHDGFNIVSGPRTTGDGYYESLVLDPEKNQIEITI